MAALVWSHWNCIRRPTRGLAYGSVEQVPADARRLFSASLVVGHGVDQIHRALLAGLRAHGEALRQVVEDEQRAECAGNAAFIGGVLPPTEN